MRWRTQLASAAIALFLTIPSPAAPKKLAEAAQPLVIKSQSYFFVGGAYVDTPQGKMLAGQMYVEYFIPQHLTRPYPIVMIHGAGQSGSNFTGTPDGREGWAQFFLRRGYGVYVVDQVARARSGYSSHYGEFSSRDTNFVERRFVAPERFNQWPQAHLHTQWPGSGLPGDAAFDQFLASQVPGLSDFDKQQELTTNAGVALLDKIGPAILLTHSQSGAMGWPIADRRPKLVRALVAVEPSGPPLHDMVQNGPPDWFADGPVARPYGITSVPITYDPPVSEPSQLQFVQQANPDQPDLVRCWLQANPARKLPRLAGIPILMVQSEASYHASYDHCTDKYLTQAGVQHTFMRLADVGIHGNGHMMMLEKNNDQIAQALARWLESNVRK